MNQSCPSAASRNTRLAVGICGVAALMLGASFAAVPLYDLFCRATGFGGTPMLGNAAPASADVSAPLVTIRFDATTAPGLPWVFEGHAPIRVPMGGEAVAFYTARNTSEAPVVGTATWNVTPEKVGRYFNKTACFCFEQQRLEPGQQVEMPVAFWVDPALATDPGTREIRTITLHYTFHRDPADARAAAALANAGPHVGPLHPAAQPSNGGG